MKEIKVDVTLKPSAKIILSEKEAVTDPYTTKINQTGTSQVGAISKAQKAQNIFFWKKI